MFFMKHVLYVLLLAVFACSFFSLVSAPAHAIQGKAADAIRQGADQIGQAAFEEDSTSGDAFTQRIGEYIKIILGIVGIIVVCFMIYAGFLWMTAGGDTKNVDKAKTMMTNTIIGLAIVLAAYVITDFVISKLLTASEA